MFGELQAGVAHSMSCMVEIVFVRQEPDCDLNHKDLSCYTIRTDHVILPTREALEP